MRISEFAVFGGCLLCFASSLPAAPPDVKWVYPTGAQIGQKVTVKVSGKLNQPGTSFWCDHPEVVIEIPEGENDVGITSSPKARPGLCWLRFFNAEGATAQIPFVLGRLPEVVEVEPNNEVSKAQLIEKSSVVNAKLGEANDVDVYAVPLKKGQTLVAQIDANWRLGFPVDPVMQILSANGTVIEQVDDDHGFDPIIAFEAPTDGTWLVRVFGFPATPNSTIRFAGGADYIYRLTLTTESFVNHCLPLAVQSGSDTLVTLTGWNLSKTLTEPFSVDMATLPGLTHAELSQLIPLSIVDEPVLVVAEPCNSDKPLSITTPMTVCGVIDQPRDEDFVTFSAKKGEVLVIDVESRSLGYPLDPVVTVLDSEGKVVIESDDAVRNEFDSRLKFAPKADGEYTVRIRDLFGNGGWRFAWRMSIRPSLPSVNMTLKSDTFTAIPGTPLEIPVAIARLEGFKEEITITVLNLPEGAIVEPVKSEIKGDSSKAVKLSLKTDDAKPFNGPIRIVGTHGDSSTVTATFQLTTFKRSTDAAWLTILPRKVDDKPKEATAEEPAK
ncbi:MAG: PPC domain-containing protein [Planctomycetota bacterium]|nr:PPC domain-containing protein [Planctomycetota bacterium]